MKEQLINFETAKLAKEKGFNWETYLRYQDGNLTGGALFNHNSISMQSVWNVLLCSAPSQSFLQKWLRDIYKIHIELNLNFCPDAPNEYGYGISIMTNCDNFDEVQWIGNDLTGVWFKSYEEAIEAGLIKGLNLIK